MDIGDAEDVLQDVFYELTETYRMMKSVGQVTAWLYMTWLRERAGE
jgi:DNA-directed RNA polymerase specialized sigma24 family protein